MFIPRRGSMRCLRCPTSGTFGVAALLPMNGGVLAGGNFTRAGGMPSGFLARWECETCAADFDGDRFVTGTDFDLFVVAFEAGETSADFDGDGFVTGVDFDRGRGV